MLRPLFWMWVPVVLVVVAFVVYRRLPRRGRALANRLSMFDVWDIWQGLVGAILLGFLLYTVGEGAVDDPVTRNVLVVMVAAMALVGLIGLAWRRWRR